VVVSRVGARQHFPAHVVAGSAMGGSSATMWCFIGDYVFGRRRYRRTGDSGPRSVHCAGPIMASLAGLGVGGAVGGLIGALVGMGIPELRGQNATKAESRTVVSCCSVHCDTADEIARAKELLKRTGAEDISSAGEKASSSHGVETEFASSKVYYTAAQKFGDMDSLTLQCLKHPSGVLI